MQLNATALKSSECAACKLMRSDLVEHVAYKLHYLQYSRNDGCY